MGFEIKKPAMPQKTFILNRPMHVTADGKAVEEDDEKGVKVLGGAGSAFYEEEAKQYGLDDSHRMVDKKPVATTQPLVEPEPPLQAPVPVEPVPAPKPSEDKAPDTPQVPVETPEPKEATAEVRKVRTR